MRLLLFLFLVLGSLYASVSEVQAANCFGKIECVTNSTARSLAKKYDIEWFGSGHLQLSFNVYRILTLEEARGLVIACVDHYVGSLNGNKSALECHRNSPFEAKDISVTLYVYTAQGHRSYFPQVSVVSQESGTIEYAFFSPENRYTYDHTYQESYQDAKSIINQSDSAPRTRPFDVEASLTALAKRAKQQGLVLDGVGFGDNQVSLSFTIYRLITTPEARSLLRQAVALAQETIIRDINRTAGENQELDLQGLKLAIYSYDGKPDGLAVHYPKAPNVELIALQGGQVTYHCLNEKYQRQMVHEFFSQCCN